MSDFGWDFFLPLHIFHLVLSRAPLAYIFFQENQSIEVRIRNMIMNTVKSSAPDLAMARI